MEHIIVIGGGPAGLMAAGQAARRGFAVTLLEGQPRPGRKLRITGKGRCNVTNCTDLNGLIANVPQNGRFLYSAFSAFSSEDTMAFFEGLGVPLKVERGNRVFPQSDRAEDIVDVLVGFAKRAGVRFRFEKARAILRAGECVTGVELASGERLLGDGVILATGGLSYPLTGSTGDGYRMAREVGHTVTQLRPSLVPLCVQEEFCGQLQGLSLKNVLLEVLEAGRQKPVYREQGEMLFTHFGISGPLVLSASAHLRKMGSAEYLARIDLKPALSNEQLDQRLLREFSQNSNRDYSNVLSSLLPAKLIPVFVRLSGIPAAQKAHQITKQQRAGILGLLKGLPLHITGFRPIEEAVVTSGGISVREVDPKTMRSKLLKGLSFAGEILDVDAYTGGFNLQIAFSTGYLAGIKWGKGEEK